MWKNVGRVFIVYNPIHPPPSFLNLSHPQITMVPHRDIMPQSSLPTFNSWAVLWSLTNIAGLSSWYYIMDDDYFFGPSGSCPPLAVQARTNWAYMNLRRAGLFSRTDVDPFFHYQNNSNTALNAIFGEEKIQGERMSELHRPYLHNLCIMHRAQKYLIPSQRAASVMSKHRNPASDMTLYTFYPGLVASLGLMTDIQLADDPATVILKGSIISPMYSEVHWSPQHAESFEGSLLQAEEAQSCFMNVQGYRKIKGDPAYTAVTAFFERNYPIASSIEAQY
jgi:hypothetical protein